jgi:hypothetical protein
MLMCPAVGQRLAGRTVSGQRSFFCFTLTQSYPKSLDVQLTMWYFHFVVLLIFPQSEAPQKETSHSIVDTYGVADNEIKMDAHKL